MISFSIPGEAVAFARAGKNGKRHFTPSKQAAFMGAVKLFAQRALAGQEPFEGPVRIAVRADYLHPASWSAKKKAATVWKTSKPDADNIAKLLKDALNKVAFHDDAQVAELIVQKRYAPFACLTVSVERLQG